MSHLPEGGLKSGIFLLNILNRVILLMTYSQWQKSGSVDGLLCIACCIYMMSPQQTSQHPHSLHYPLSSFSTCQSSSVNPFYNMDCFVRNYRPSLQQAGKYPCCFEHLLILLMSSSNTACFEEICPTPTARVNYLSVSIVLSLL